MTSHPMAGTGSLPTNSPIKHLISYLYKSKPPQLKTEAIHQTESTQCVSFGLMCLQSIMLNHELGHQRIRELVFLQALFSPQALDRNPFICEIPCRDTDLLTITFTGLRRTITICKGPRRFAH